MPFHIYMHNKYERQSTLNIYLQDFNYKTLQTIIQLFIRKQISCNNVDYIHTKKMKSKKISSKENREEEKKNRNRTELNN